MAERGPSSSSSSYYYKFILLVMVMDIKRSVLEWFDLKVEDVGLSLGLECGEEEEHSWEVAGTVYK